MELTIKTALNDQANFEFFASLCYRAMSYWCEAQDYSGFAEFFSKQASEELEHADLFGKHLLDRGIQPVLSSMETPKNEFKSLLELAQFAQTIEAKNTAQISHCYELAVDVKDYGAQPMLLRFVEEQIEEDAWAAKMLSLVARSECPGAMLNLDRHIMKELA